MRASEIITEKWSKKYKRSIDCSNPKGFSQRAHCDGRKKTNEDATGMGAGSVAAVVVPLGGTAKKLKEKNKNYTNVIKRGGTVKANK